MVKELIMMCNQIVLLARAWDEYKNGNVSEEIFEMILSNIESAALQILQVLGAKK